MPGASRSSESSRTASSASALYRVNLMVGALGAAALLIAVTIAFGAMTFAPPSASELFAACQRFLLPEPSPTTLLVLALMALGAVAAYRAARCLVREHGLQRRFLDRLRVVGESWRFGQKVVLVDDSRPQAFCAGYLRPRLYLSTGALVRLTPAELRAVVAHERHHMLRRDPLRVLLVRVLGEALFFIPILRRLSARYAAMSELAADEAAAREIGDRRPLASALLAFGETGSPAVVVGIACERVDHLLGERPRWEVSVSLMAGSLVAIAGLLVLGLTAASATSGSSLNLPMLIAESCMVLMFALPAAIVGSAVVFTTSLLPRRAAR